LPARQLLLLDSTGPQAFEDLWQQQSIGFVAPAAHSDLRTIRDGQLLAKPVILKIWKSMEASALPLDFQAFNKFHHGAKVRAQDMELLLACADAGEREGQSMVALKTLLNRLNAQAPA
jgi:hypothetical protein